VVLTPRRWRQVWRSYPLDDGGKRARSPGRARRKPLKPLRGECRAISGVTVVTNACAFYTTHAAAGRTGRPAFPAPSVFRERTFRQPRAEQAARSRSHILTSLRGAKRRSNPASLLLVWQWIASRSLSSGAHSRDPLARNDVQSNRHRPPPGRRKREIRAVDAATINWSSLRTQGPIRRGLSIRTRRCNAAFEAANAGGYGSLRSQGRHLEDHATLRVSRSPVAGMTIIYPHLVFISASRAADNSRNSRALPPASGCARLATHL
jgi:hypothetical protein